MAALANIERTFAMLLSAIESRNSEDIKRLTNPLILASMNIKGPTNQNAVYTFITNVFSQMRVAITNEDNIESAFRKAYGYYHIVEIASKLLSILFASATFSGFSISNSEIPQTFTGLVPRFISSIWAIQNSESISRVYSMAIGIYKQGNRDYEYRYAVRILSSINSSNMLFNSLRNALCMHFKTEYTQYIQTQRENLGDTTQLLMRFSEYIRQEKLTIREFDATIARDHSQQIQEIFIDNLDTTIFGTIVQNLVDSASDCSDSDGAEILYNYVGEYKEPREITIGYFRSLLDTSFKSELDSFENTSDDIAYMEFVAQLYNKYVTRLFANISPKGKDAVHFTNNCAELIYRLLNEDKYKIAATSVRYLHHILTRDMSYDIIEEKVNMLMQILLNINDRLSIIHFYKKALVARLVSGKVSEIDNIVYRELCDLGNSPELTNINAIIAADNLCKEKFPTYKEYAAQLEGIAPARVIYIKEHLVDMYLTKNITITWHPDLQANISAICNFYPQVNNAGVADSMSVNYRASTITIDIVKAFVEIVTKGAAKTKKFVTRTIECNFLQANILILFSELKAGSAITWGEMLNIMKPVSELDKRQLFLTVRQMINIPKKDDPSENFIGILQSEPDLGPDADDYPLDLKIKIRPGYKNSKVAPGKAININRPYKEQSREDEERIRKEVRQKNMVATECLIVGVMKALKQNVRYEDLKSSVMSRLLEKKIPNDSAIVEEAVSNMVAKNYIEAIDVGGQKLYSYMA